MPRISVVIPTFERPEAAERAVASALDQMLPAAEVLVCDDGSRDATGERFSRWERSEPRLRYLRLPHAGSPGPTRTAGVRAATGEWIAFLDDDDRWHPGKLELQAPHLGGDVVVATNALRSSGAPYFPDMRAPLSPTRAQLLRDNPLIVSTVVARRDSLLDAGGFLEPAWARGVADYAMWLRLAERGARFLVLPDVAADYDDGPAGRLSSAPVRQEAAVARMTWHHWATGARDRAVLRAALSHTAAVARVAVEAAWSGRRRR